MPSKGSSVLSIAKMAIQNPKLQSRNQVLVLGVSIVVPAAEISAKSFISYANH